MSRTSLPRLPRPAACVAALCLGPAGALAASIVCDGVLGNSGEQGETLVRFAEMGASGMGVAYDRFGSLWDRAGKGRLGRYTPDGRLLGQYGIPDGNDRNRDMVTVVGDTLVLRIYGRLYRLSVTAPSGTAAESMGIEANISWASVNGRLACIESKRRLSLLDPSNGRREEVATLPFEAGWWMDMGAGGAVYAMDGSRRVHKIVNGREVREGWPKRAPGERPQLIATREGDFWFVHSWHGTIKRFDVDLQPAPGVVEGGASGSFIGHLAQNSELLNGRGMAYLGRRLYAVSGMGCVMHLLEWRPEARRMEIVRRIGALAHVAGLGLDSKGRIFCVNGSWNWDDLPDAPQRFGMVADVCGQVVTLEDDHVVAPGLQYGNQPRVLHGTLDREVEVSGHKEVKLEKNVAGSAVYRRDGKLVLLVVTRSGKGQAINIGSDGRFLNHAGDVVFRTKSPVKEWTTLALVGGAKDGGTLLGAADGHVIDMAREGNDWRETRRWNSFVPVRSRPGPPGTDNAPGRADTFGARIYIAADAAPDGLKLWVADRERHRVCCLDPATGELIATFGTADKEGTGLDGLSRPQVIAARDGRAVVFDRGNQRLVKLRLRR